MNPIRHLRRLAAVLAGLAVRLLGLAAFAPAAFASPPEPPGWNKHPPLRRLRAGTGPGPHRRRGRHARLADRPDRRRRCPARGHHRGAGRSCASYPPASGHRGRLNQAGAERR